MKTKLMNTTTANGRELGRTASNLNSGFSVWLPPGIGSTTARIGQYNEFLLTTSWQHQVGVELHSFPSFRLFLGFGGV